MRETSYRAWEECKERGLLPPARLFVLQLLIELGPLTGAEVNEEARKRGHRSHYHKRLSELRDSGCAVEVGERKCRVTGRQSIQWGATGEIPREPTPRQYEPPIAAIPAILVKRAKGPGARVRAAMVERLRDAVQEPLFAGEPPRVARSSTSMHVDYRQKPVGYLVKPGSTVAECPVCKLGGYLDDHPTRPRFIHAVEIVAEDGETRQRVTIKCEVPIEMRDAWVKPRAKP